MATVTATVNASIPVVATVTGFTRTDLTQEDYVAEQIEDPALRLSTAYETPITTPAGANLGLTAGVFGTGCPYITAGDLKAAGATTRYLRFRKTLPKNYVDGGAVRVTMASGMVTTVADTTCTVDLECFLEAGDVLKSGSDLVTTAAQSINSLTFATKNFELSSASLVRGNKLDFRLAIACTDAATATAVIGAIAKLAFTYAAKG